MKKLLALATAATLLFGITGIGLAQNKMTGHKPAKTGAKTAGKKATGGKKTTGAKGGKKATGGKKKGGKM